VCNDCYELGMTIRLMPLETLFAVAERLRRAEGAGRIEQLDGFGGADAIAPGKPTPAEDTVLRFRCRHCRQEFSLRCNSSYGRGGSWGPAPANGFPARPASYVA
jgi:hypothetical protein